MVRVMAVVEEDQFKETKIREDHMPEKFPSIWMEIKRRNEKELLFCGFYREWTRNGINSEEQQLKYARNPTGTN